MAIEAQLYSDNLGIHSSNNPQCLSSMENNIWGLHQFCSNLEEKPLQYQQSMQTQSLVHHRGGLNNMADYYRQLVLFSPDLAYLFEKQRIEIDRFVNLQNEKLKLALQEESKQKLSLILKKYEAKIEYLLRQKDDEIAKALNKTMELQEFMKRVEIENQTWQKLAKENEAMALSLNNKIEHLKASAAASLLSNNNEAEDAESCCYRATTDSIEVKVEENLENISSKKMVVLCKGCNIRSSCIIILPCRHLCLCQSCEAFLHSCPVCGTEKKATIQALI